MYQLAKHAPASTDVNALFTKYYDQLTKSTSASVTLRAVEIEYAIADEDSAAVQQLKETILKYPEGLPIPYMP